MTWLRSERPTENGPDGSDLWHLGRKREIRGEVSGKLMRTYYVTACTGRQLGGSWGQEQQESRPSNVCVRCARLEAKEAAADAAERARMGLKPASEITCFDDDEDA